jgi:hypothetical protein
MKNQYFKALFFPNGSLVARLEFWQNCTPQELRYAMKVKHQLSEAKLI